MVCGAVEDMRILRPAFLCLVLLFVETAGMAATGLNRGDIAIVGLNTHAEDFAFVVLRDVEAGTSIHFSDNDVTADGSDELKSTEGVVKYTAPNAIVKGTAIRFSDTQANFAPVKGTFSLANTGDNVAAFVGFDPATNRATSFLHAVGKRGKQTRPAGLTSCEVVLLDAPDGEYAMDKTGSAGVLWAMVNTASYWTTYENFNGTLSATPFAVTATSESSPNVFVCPHLDFAPILPTSHTVQSLAVFNTASSQTLTVLNTTTIAGADAAFFHLDTPVPIQIPPGASASLAITFDPAGNMRTFRAQLDVRSTDPDDPLTTVSLWASAAPPPDYSGLIVTEVVTRPTEDEYVEILYSPQPGSPSLDISGVALSDEDISNTEGALRFPDGTMIAPGEVIVAAVGGSDTKPSWLDGLPPAVRVFHETSRDTTSWAPKHGNPLISMRNFPTSEGGTSGRISLSEADGVALYQPSVRFAASGGPTPPTACLDGMNYNSSDSGPVCPINPLGQLDSRATRAGTGETALGNGFTRFRRGRNAASNLIFREQKTSPGVFVILARAGTSWERYR
jgi:hypothetical protein